jgi:hypothetical protein
LRLFLPQGWTNDPSRLQRAGVPLALRIARTKPQIALAEIDRMIAGGIRFGCVLADAGYGQSAPFRQELTRRKLTWAVGIPRHLKVYPVGVQLIFPTARRGRPRQRSIPDVLSVPAEDMLASAKWRTISWRTGTKGKLKARFAAVRVRTADGPPQRIRDKGQQHLPGDEAWLVGEQRASGEKKYYLANLPAGTNLRTLGGHHQGAMGLRTGPPADERRTRPRSLRRPLLARSSPPCADDDDRLRLPPASPPRSSKGRKKEPTGHRLSPACLPCETPSSASSSDRCSDVRTVEDRSTGGGLKQICQSSARFR